MKGVIEGLVGGATQITVADRGHAINLAMRQRDTLLEETLTAEQSKRLRKLLAAAEARARSVL